MASRAPGRQQSRAFNLDSPYDLENYLLQRFSEFFGPDVETILGASALDLPGIAASAQEWPAGFEPITEVEAMAPATLTTGRTAKERKAMKQFIPLDIVETKDHILVEASLPGVPKDHIDITVDHNNVLILNVRAVPHMAHTCGFKLEAKDVPQEPVTIKPEQQQQQKEQQQPKPQKEQVKEQQRPQAKAEMQSPVATPTGSPKKTQQEHKESESKEHEEEGYRVLLSERHKGHLHRSVRLPKVADAEKVKTCMESGVLCIVFDKLPASHTTRRIKL